MNTTKQAAMNANKEFNPIHINDGCHKQLSTEHFSIP